jgi:hypothetical protein
MFKKNIFFLIICLVFTFGIINANTVLASNTNGTIDSTNKYAWGENIGWLNFSVNNGDIQITDTGLTGYVWSENYGWISLDTNVESGSVTNDGEGNLGGNAWGERLGWINFNRVIIDEDGYFSGYATIASDDSKISFNCLNTTSCNLSDFKVSTDWRPRRTRTHTTRWYYPKPITPTFVPVVIPTTIPVIANFPVTPNVIVPVINPQIKTITTISTITEPGSKLISKITGDGIQLSKCKIFISPNIKQKNICTTCDTFISPSILQQKTCKKEIIPAATKITKPSTTIKNINNTTTYIKTHILQPVINEVLHIYTITKTTVLSWWQKVIVYFLSDNK